MAETNREFNHVANGSPRSGSLKQVAPVLWCMIVVTATAIATWFAMKP
jgi:hypothetical protein